MPDAKKPESGSMKKVLIITYYWPPSGGAGVQRWLKMVRYFPENGIEPVILTVDPARASYPLLDHSLEHDVPSHTKVFKTNTFEPLSIYRLIFSGGRLPKPGFSDDSDPGVLKKIARYIRGNIFIPDARIGWKRFALKKSLEIMRRMKISAVICTSPPHSTQLVGLALKRKTGIPLIIDLRDPWTDIYYMHKLFRSRFAMNQDLRMENKVLENADLIITVSESLKNLFRNKIMDVAPKIEVITNGFDHTDFENLPTSVQHEFVITYAGTMSDDYPTDSFIHAVKSVLNDLPDLRIRINLIGQFSEAIVQNFRLHGLGDRINLFGYLDHLEVIKILNNSSILLLIIPDVAQNEGIVTGKLFEYLAIRKPILCFGPLYGDAAKIINECESGKVFGYDQPSEAAVWLKDHARKFFKNQVLSIGNQNITKYTRQFLAKKYCQEIEKLLSKTAMQD